MISDDWYLLWKKFQLVFYFKNIKRDMSKLSHSWWIYRKGINWEKSPTESYNVSDKSLSINKNVPEGFARLWKAPQGGL